MNDLLLQVATPEQRETFEQSALDEYLLDTARDERRRAEAVLGGRSEPALDRFIPRRGDGVMLSASDIETYRLCPLKYKFARVFRIPEEPTINQRFGIAVHQVLERFHTQGGGSLEDLMHLFEVAWRRNGFGALGRRAAVPREGRDRADALLGADQEREGEPVWFERGFAFKLGEHFVRGRVDRIDRLPDGSYELIDYKTGWAEDRAAAARGRAAVAVPDGRARGLGPAGLGAVLLLRAREREGAGRAHRGRARARAHTVGAIADGILAQEFEPTPRARHLRGVRLPDHLPGGREVA